MLERWWDAGIGSAVHPLWKTSQHFLAKWDIYHTAPAIPQLGSIQDQWNHPFTRCVQECPWPLLSQLPKPNYKAQVSINRRTKKENSALYSYTDSYSEIKSWFTTDSHNMDHKHVNPDTYGMAHLHKGGKPANNPQFLGISCGASIRQSIDQQVARGKLPEWLKYCIFWLECWFCNCQAHETQHLGSEH